MWLCRLCDRVGCVIEWLMWLGGLFDRVVYVVGTFMWFGDLCSQGLALLPFFMPSRIYSETEIPVLMEISCEAISN